MNVMFFAAFFIFSLILLFDFAEVTRKFPISNFEQIIFAIKLSLLRTPNTFCEILHYVYFISATFSLWHLSASNQMTILKSAGRSPMQILRPFVFFSVCMASVWLFILHPVGNYTEAVYNKLVKSQIQNANENIWIDYVRDNQLIFLRRIVKNHVDGMYLFDTRNNRRVFANSANINKNEWNLREIKIIDCNSDKITVAENMVIHNRISEKLIKLLTKKPKKHNIYSLFNVYSIQNNDKVGLQLYVFELHKLLANCMYFVLFALIAAAICFPINRYKTRTSIAVQLIIIAMFLRFLDNMADSLARTNVLDITLAAWAVVMCAFFVTIGILIWKEV